MKHTFTKASRRRLATRPTTASAIVSLVIVGLLSRRFAFVPLFIGDVLWASLVYFLFRFVFIKTTVKAIAIYSLVFSFAIEFSQLYTAPWIEQLRRTLFGKLVLGSTFIWSDLVCYAVGVFIAAGIELLLVRGSSARTTCKAID